MRRPTDPERVRLHELFAQLCAIESPFGHEAAMADRVEEELRSLGLEVQRDAFGNLLSRVPAPGATRTILLCAHLDTVTNHGPIEPVAVDEGWENAREDILGADNKAAVAVMLLAAARAATERLPVGLELLFTLQEENGLVGAQAFDVSALRADYGFVFDHATPIGEIIVASPTYYRFEARFRGRAAHAGIRPEDGRSAIAAAARAVVAMRLGRLDGETTANIGTISGGVGGTNVVPERSELLGEVRSLDDAKAEAVVAEMIDAVHEAANDPEGDVDADVTVQRQFQGYRHRPGSPAVAAAEQALRAVGYEPRHVPTGGGADANALEAAGFHCVCLANGTERAHEPTERVSFAALEGMLEVTYALADAAASSPTY
jgi:tripeptide aminopeptidase